MPMGTFSDTSSWNRSVILRISSYAVPFCVCGTANASNNAPIPSVSSMEMTLETSEKSQPRRRQEVSPTRTLIWSDDDRCTDFGVNTVFLISVTVAGIIALIVDEGLVQVCKPSVHIFLFACLSHLAFSTFRLLARRTVESVLALA